MGQGQVRLDHHGAVVRILRVTLEALGLFNGQRRPVDAVGTVDFRGNALDALAERHVQRIEVVEFGRLFAGVNDEFGQFNGALAAVLPVLGQGAADAALFAEPADELNFCIRVRVELVDADDRFNAGFNDVVDVVEQVFAALFQELEVFRRIGVRQRTAGYDFRSAAVHLQSTDGGHDD